MLTEYEARKLQDDMRRELDSQPATLWKCAAGLLVVIVLVLLGSVDFTQREIATDTTALARAGHTAH